MLSASAISISTTLAMPKTAREMNSMAPDMPAPAPSQGTTEPGTKSSRGWNSGSDAQRRGKLAQGRQDRERDDPAGLGIFRRHVLDRERERGRIRINLDDVAIARLGRVGPDVDHGAVR